MDIINRNKSKKIIVQKTKQNKNIEKYMSRKITLQAILLVVLVQTGFGSIP